MIEIGKQIVRLEDRFPHHYAWSRFGWLLIYPDKLILFHALSSKTIFCNPNYESKIEKGALATCDRKALEKAGIILTAKDQDDALTERVKAKVSKPKPLTTLFLIVTDRCNLRCRYCYEDLPCYSRGKSMTTTVMKESIKRFLTLAEGDAKIFFYGGEPMLRENAVRNAIRYTRRTLHNQQAELQITTNATVFRPDFVEFLKAHNAGVGISLDGRERTNNLMRSPKNKKTNVFQRALSLIQQCQKREVDYSVLCTVTEDNAAEVIDIARFFVEELGVKKVNFNLRIRQPAEKKEDKKEFWHQTALNIAEAYFLMLEWSVVEGRTLRYISGFTEGTYSISECDAGYGAQIVVNPDEQIGPCQGFLYDPTFFTGSVDWRQVTEHSLWQRFFQNTPLNMPTCQECPFLGTCGGGCHYNRLTFSEPNPNFCQYMRSLIYAVIGKLDKINPVR